MANRRASGEGLLRWRKDRKHWEGRIAMTENLFLSAFREKHRERLLRK